jgi:hypothetical protein
MPEIENITYTAKCKHEVVWCAEKKKSCKAAAIFGVKRQQHSTVAVA